MKKYNIRLSPEDANWVIRAVNVGIDARLAAFTKSEFWQGDGFLYAWIDDSEWEILIRRLVELEDTAEYDRERDLGPEELADDIVRVVFLEEDQDLY